MHQGFHTILVGIFLGGNSIGGFFFYERINISSERVSGVGIALKEKDRVSQDAENGVDFWRCICQMQPTSHIFISSTSSMPSTVSAP